MANRVLTNTLSDNYKMLKVLGHGCYGHVVKCFKRDTKENVAVKILKKKYSKDTKIREVFILKKLRCLDPDRNNIVRCHEYFHSIDQIFMVFETLDMSLYDYISKTKCARLPLNGIRTVITDVATALNALKGIGLIHTDLKLDNIMLVDHQRQPFRVKVIDFGLTLQRSEAKQGLTVQPLWYRSPEILLGLQFTEAIDIWSLGLVTAEILLGFPLFPGTCEYDVLRFIIELLGKPPERLLNLGQYTPQFYRGSRKYLVLMNWTFMTPKEFRNNSGIKPMETRKPRLFSLDELKTFHLLQEYRAEAADRNACVELLKKMLQVDPKRRITPSQILAHPFITRSNLSPSLRSHEENAAAETSEGQAVSNTKDTTQTAADDRCPIKLPPGVIMVRPAENTSQTKEEEQSTAINPMAVQDKMTDYPKAKDDRDLLKYHTYYDISDDSGLVMKFITNPLPSHRVEAPDNVWNQALHMPEVSEAKKKKKRKRILRFISTLKRKCFSCFCVPKDNDD